ncbi:MAG TPA: HEAT repeat domain-containing protein, partial [Gemmataceae bacterium]
RYYERVRGWAPSLVLRTIADTHRFKPITDKVRQVDHHGGYTAGAGHSLYTARNYPKEYWNRVAFVNGPTGHLTGAFVISRDGSDFRSTNPFNLLASDDEWTAPIMAEVGPDGNVWVIDWYNYIVQHNPTPQGFRTGRGAAYETDLRDKKYGRVYRIVYERAEKRPPFSLKDATPEKLVETLRHDNLFWRRHAQRLLVERGERDVVPALVKLARDKGVDAIGLNVGAIHALWTMHGLGALDGSDAEATAVAVAALKHPSAGVRRNAVQVLPRNEESVAAVLKAGLLADPDPQVRLMALLALADLPPNPEAGKAVVDALADPVNASDRWIPDAATSAAANNAEHFLRGLAAQKEPSEKLFGVATIVAEHYARGGPADSVGDLLAGLAGADPRIADAVVDGLANGWPKGQSPKMDERLEQGLERLVERLSPGRRAQLVKLATSWGSKKFEKYAAEITRTLLARAGDESLGARQRSAAAAELVEYRSADPETVRVLLDLITPQTPPEVSAGILGALRQSTAPEAGKLVLERLSGMTPAGRSAAIGVLLSRPEWTRTLLEAADKGTVQLSDLSLDQKQALSDHPDRRVRRRAVALLERGGALPSPDRQKVLEELMEVTRMKGDPAAGKLVFANQCAKCHVHGGEGTHIGPDLTGMAVHPKEELLTHIIDPSRSVEGNFRVYTVETAKGTVLSGLLASESRTAVELFDAEGKKITLLREEIEALTASPKSLMPDGFEKQIDRKGMADLLEFLTQRGKYLPLPLDKVATAVSTRSMFVNPDAPVERLIFDDWKPKTFEGVPFQLVDPQGGRVPNAVLLHAPQGTLPQKMPRSVSLPVNAPAAAVHFLSGVSGWGFPYSEKGSVSMIVRIHYADGKTEDHELKNGEHFADYIRRVDVPGSKFAFDLRGRQIRYLAVRPQRKEVIERIELVKGPDPTAPVVMAVTVEMPE